MKRHLCLAVIVIFCFYTSCNQKDTNESMIMAAPQTKQWLPEDTRNLVRLDARRGVTINTPAATPGYILFHPSDGTSTYLMNLAGAIVHEWKGEMFTMNSYLQADGRIFRMERDPDFPVFDGGGQSGVIREYSWNGEILWNFKYATESHLTHHDFEVMPNGNILAIAWEAKTKEEAIAAGSNPELTPKAGLWPDKIIEIEPQRPEGGKIVWEWHLWDHLVQEYDAEKANYGKVREHPRKININAYASAPKLSEEEIEQRKKAGNLGMNATVENRGSDMTHINAVDYNQELDQIAISSANFHEIWIIDHSTTTKEARGSTGGRWGHGGDLLFRWGCDLNYGWGTRQDQRLFGQHDIQWVPQGYPGAGNLLVFNNDIIDPRSKYPNGFAALAAANSIEVKVADLANYSAVHEFQPTRAQNGAYKLSTAGHFEPEHHIWSYIAPDTLSFYSPFVSGAHRMKNGNTFITEGSTGRLMEVTQSGQIVWEYLNPYNQQYRLPNGLSAQPTGPFLYVQFRATHVPVDHPAFDGRVLKPIDPQPEVFIPPPAK